MLKKISLYIMLSSALFAMHTAEININNKDLEVGSIFDVGQYNDKVEPDTTFMGFKYINATSDHSEDELGNEANVSGYFELNFLMQKEVSDSGVEAGIGVKANYTKLERKKFVTIPLGLQANYTLPVKVPVTIGVAAYFAPESLASSDADSYLEYRINGSVEMIKNGSLVVGYRNISTNYNVGGEKFKVTYNKSAYFGFRFDF